MSAGFLSVNWVELVLLTSQQWLEFACYYNWTSGNRIQFTRRQWLLWKMDSMALYPSQVPSLPNPNKFFLPPPSLQRDSKSQIMCLLLLLWDSRRQYFIYPFFSPRTLWSFLPLNCLLPLSFNAYGERNKYWQGKPFFFIFTLKKACGLFSGVWEAHDGKV